MGKRTEDDSDTDDSDEEDSDDEMGDENEKSDVRNIENQSDSNKEPSLSLASVDGEKVEGESSVGCSSDVEANSSDAKEVMNEEQVITKSDCPESEKPLNFDEFNLAAEMEVLGMERLKYELQERGLKCGGTLQERAARLFLLKTTPLNMLPKKLFAKK